jgi:hypothetical protein
MMSKAPVDTGKMAIWDPLRANGVAHPMAKVCQSDYESFTDSCFAADMTCGGRIPQLWIRCADPQIWECPTMIELQQ